jgi:hypothetical protein
MDLNRLTRDADDLIRKVVSRYNQLYVPAGSISQVELDLLLDDLRELYSTFKTIGQVNLTLNQREKKPEVAVHTTVPGQVQQNKSDSHESPLGSEMQKPLPAAPQEKYVEAEMSAQAENTRESEKDSPQMVFQAETDTRTNTDDEPATEEITRQEIKNEALDVNPSNLGPGTLESQEPGQATFTQTKVEASPENAPSMLADKFNQVNKSLSDTIGSAPAKDVVGGRLLFQPISDLTTGISLNDKFSLITELFKNNQAQYDEAIARINKAVNLDEANWILQKYHTPEWDQKEEALTRMKGFIKRRFI